MQQKCFCQHFANVGGGVNNSINQLIVDQDLNLLYATGYFTLAGSVQVAKGIASYDGAGWDSIPILNDYYPGYILLKYQATINYKRLLLIMNMK